MSLRKIHVNISVRSCLSFLVCCFLTAFYFPLNAQISFAPPTNYAVGMWPDIVIAEDINGDGKVDLIIRNSGPFTLSVLTNNGSGILSPAPAPIVDGGVSSIRAADVRGIDVVDLVCASYYNIDEILVLTNQGDGNFSTASALQLSYGWDWETFSTADMVGDGKTELICRSIADWTISVWTNDGSGIFLTDYPYATGAWSDNGPISMMAADVNGDGKMDLVCGKPYSNSYSVLTNDDHGALRFANSTSVGSGSYNSAVADINGDGRPDLISVNSDDNTIMVLTNTGIGNFVNAGTYSVGPYPYSVAVADFNGDGKPDLVVANDLTNTLSVLTNNGSGSFALAMTVSLGVCQPSWVVAADINGDGKVDLVTADSNQNMISVLLNTSTFQSPVSTPRLSIRMVKNSIHVWWPSDSPGWSLQQSPDLEPANWSPAGYSGHEITDDGTNKNLLMPKPLQNLFFRLLHPQ